MSAARTISRTNARNRKEFDKSIPKRITPAVVTQVKQQLSPTIVQITFNTRVMLRETPTFKAGAGGTATVTAASQISATVIQLTFSAATAGNPVLVPANDPGIRTAFGGFVPAGSYTVTP